MIAIQDVKALQKSIYMPIIVLVIAFVLGLLDNLPFGSCLLLAIVVLSYLWGWKVIAKGYVFSSIMGIWEYYTTGDFVMALIIFCVWLTIGLYIGFFVGGYHFIKNIITYRNLIH